MRHGDKQLVSLRDRHRSLAVKKEARRGFRPFFLGTVGAVAIVAGKFYLDNDFLNKDFIGYAGIFLLVAASAWNVWPRKGATGTTHPLEPYDENKHTLN